METYTIGQVSQQLGISVAAIRYYDSEGLLPFVKRDQGGRRIFTKDNLQLMQMILELKKAGVPVKEIAYFVSWRLDGDESLGDRYAFLAEHEIILENEIQQLEQSLAYLRFKKWYYKEAQLAGTEKIHFAPDTNKVAEKTYQTYRALLASGLTAKELGEFESPLS
jgi:DNA-binding transcriptional MerR regulator